MTDQPTAARFIAVDGAEGIPPGRFVLRERLASKQFGKPIYFQLWTRIGPSNTGNVNDAKKFASAIEAKSSQAYHHSLSSYDVVNLAEVSHD